MNDTAPYFLYILADSIADYLDYYDNKVDSYAYSNVQIVSISQDDKEETSNLGEDELPKDQNMVTNIKERFKKN